MKVKRYSNSVVVFETVGNNLQFRFEAEIIEGRYYLSFFLDNQTDPEVGKDCQVQVMRLVLRIWKSFSKYPCCCCGASEYHNGMWKKLGFVDGEVEGLLMYNP